MFPEFPSPTLFIFSIVIIGLLTQLEVTWIDFEYRKRLDFWKSVWFKVDFKFDYTFQFQISTNF